MAALSVLVVGGGIGGLSTAIALRKVGIEARIVEQAPALGAVGSGITVQVNGAAILDALGVSFASEDSVSIESFQALSSAGRVLMALQMNELALGHAMLNVHRAELQATLLRALESTGATLELGRKAMILREQGDAVDVVFEDGERGRFDLVLGADGINSTVRRSLFGSTGSRFSGQTCWRFVQPGLEQPLTTSFERWADARRVGLVPLSRGRVYGYLVQSAAAGTATEETRTLTHVRSVFDGVDPWLDQLFDTFAVREAAGTPVFFHHDDLRDQPHISFGKGRIALLGDAAHAMTPNLGQGANQAIEDAAAVAIALASGAVPPERLVDHIDGIRRDRVTALQKRAWRLGAAAHWTNPVARWVRDLALSCTPQGMAMAQARKSFMPGLELAETLRSIVDARAH